MAIKLFVAAIFFYSIILTFKVMAQNEDEYYSKGNSLFDAGNYEVAIKYYDSALTVASNNYKIWNKKAEAYYMINKLEKALECIDSSEKIITGEYRELYNKGVAYENSGDEKDSRNYYKLADVKNVDFSETMKIRAVIYVKLKRYDDASNCYKMMDDGIKIENLDKVKFVRNIIHTDFSCIYADGTASVNYERMIFKLLSVRVGYLKGYALDGDNFDRSQGGFVFINYLSSQESKFECGLGLGYYKVERRINGDGVKAGFAIGYRYQPKEFGMMVRIGASFFGEWVGGGLHLSLGTAF